MISATGISKSFGEVKAVDNVSFTINDGEITGLLGPNGAGKTTILRMLTCYLQSDSGSITVGDFDVTDKPLEVKQILGYLPESAPVYNEMLVYDFLAYIARVRVITNTERIREIGELCGINDVMHKNIGDLSKGYKQRVGLASAMIHDPDILILDEPTSGLDPNQIIEIRKLIREIGKTKTVILSTHILPEVEATCDRVIIIDRGSIVADDLTSNLQSYSSMGNVINVSVTGTDFSSLSHELMGIKGVISVEEAPGDGPVSARVSVGAENDARPEIFKLAGKKDWILYELSREQQSLEKVFRELTTGGGNGK